MSTLLYLLFLDVLLGKLSTIKYEVGGDVYMRDSNTLVIKKFSYNGGGPDAFFYVGTSVSLELSDRQSDTY